MLEEVTEKAKVAEKAKEQVQQVKDRAQTLVDSIAVSIIKKFSNIQMWHSRDSEQYCIDGPSDLF